MLKTPVLLIIFNRPDTTNQVFNQIKKARPEKLFISADGPRSSHSSDIDNCKRTREVIEQVDWECDVKTLFHEKNLGCGLAPSRAISWFFEQVGEGIILEDDCLPSESFFSFCEKLLEYYRHDTRVFHIGGTSYTHHLKNAPKSTYYFTNVPRIWGWATWRRAWSKYNFYFDNLQEFKLQETIKDIFNNEILQIVWTGTFDGVSHQQKTTAQQHIWDAQWVYTVVTQRGLCITPTQNLISNIGCDEQATHTKNFDPLLYHTKTEIIDFSRFQHPLFMVPNREDDLWMLENVFKIKDKLSWKIKRRIKHYLPWMVRMHKKVRDLKQRVFPISYK